MIASRSPGSSIVRLPVGSSATKGNPLSGHRPSELIYSPRLGELEAVSATTRPTFAFGRASPVPRTFNWGAPSVRALYDITPNGRFVGVRPVGDTGAIYSAPQIQVVLNWLEELRRFVPSK